LFPTSWWTQFTQIWRRTLLYKLREPAAVMTQFSTAVIMPLIVGGIFWSISLSQSAVMDRLAAVSFTVLMQAFMCIDQILLFPRERAVYLRDHATGLHSTSSFFIARSLAEMPFILTFAYICATISYFMFGFQRDGRKYLIFVIIIMTVTEAGAALLTSLGALSPDMETGNLLATLLIVILTLLDGFYRNLKDVPLWCRWVSSFSFLGYGVQAAAVNEFSGLVFTCTDEEALTGCIPDGEAFLQRQSLDKTNIGANIGYIVLLAAGSRFVAYLALRFLYTGQSFRERLAQP
jgi:ABC-type multidrug transport system permease subunit